MTDQEADKYAEMVHNWMQEGAPKSARRIIVYVHERAIKEGYRNAGKLRSYSGLIDLIFAGLIAVFLALGGFICLASALWKLVELGRHLQ